MNQSNIPQVIATRIEEMRAMFTEAKLLRQSGRPITASCIEDEACEHRKVSLAIVRKVYPDLRDVPDYVRVCLNVRGELANHSTT